MNRLDYLPLAGQIASMCFAMTMVIMFFYVGLAAATTPEQGLTVGGIVSAPDPLDKTYVMIVAAVIALLSLILAEHEDKIGKTMARAVGLASVLSSVGTIWFLLNPAKVFYLFVEWYQTPLILVGFAVLVIFGGCAWNGIQYLTSPQ